MVHVCTLGDLCSMRRGCYFIIKSDKSGSLWYAFLPIKMQFLIKLHSFSTVFLGRIFVKFFSVF